MQTLLYQSKLAGRGECYNALFGSSPGLAVEVANNGVRMS